MAVVGCLGDIVFQVSDDTIRTINNMKWSGSARYSTHQRHLTNALTEFTGIDPDKMSFDIILIRHLGGDPVKTVATLFGYERNGTPLSLVIGDKGYGKYRWTILSHEMKTQMHDGAGNIASAIVSVSLQEYLRS